MICDPPAPGPSSSDKRHRARVKLIVVAGVWLFGLHWLLGSALAALPTTSPIVLKPDECATLMQYAKDTWRGFDKLLLPTSLPADGLRRQGDGWVTPWTQTSPTNIAAYLWSVLAAERLHLISPAEARMRLDRTITSLEGMERMRGFFVNELDARTGAIVKLSRFDAKPPRVRISAVDNAWLGVALTMVANSQPDFRVRARKLLEPMDFRFFYDPYDAADPVDHPGQLHVGYRPGERRDYGHYGMLNSEARIASYLAIARGQLPPEHYYRMFRTLPQGLTAQSQIPRGETRKYLGIPVFEGHYDHLGARIVPSWGGSMFEALMVTLFVPEDRWAPNSWGMNHPLYVQAQIKHGLQEEGYGYWGFSPAASPRGGYQVYGVKPLGTYAQGYFCHEIGLPAPVQQVHRSPDALHMVVTPHASFLALRYAPHEAIANLRALATAFPIYCSLGFQDSVDVSAGVVAGCILTLDQGMIMAAIANALADDAIQHIFSDGPIEQKIRPLIAMEEFSTAPPGQLVEAKPAANDGHGPKAKTRSAR